MMLDYTTWFFIQLWRVSLEAAPWLLLGMIVAGLIKVWLPASWLQRWLGGRGLWPILKAAVIGTPLPLCSCSVIPAAVALRRAGASKSSTVSFLVSTPENGADSIALTYALLGPFMTIARPVAAIISATTAGLATLLLNAEDDPLATNHPPQSPATGCCSGGGCCDANTQTTEAATPSVWAKLKLALAYAGGDLFKDIAGWLAVGLVLAALMNTFIPPDAMASWGSGLLAMLAVMLVGVPMYICATASTPVAASMLLAGVSPGTVLVFLLAGPATNLATIGIVRRELGWRSMAAYLFGVCGSALVLGLATDWIVRAGSIPIHAQLGDEHELIPHWLAIGSLITLSAMAGHLVYHRFRGRSQHCLASAADKPPVAAQP